MAHDEVELLTALRAGDEDAFARIVREWSRPMLVLARGFVPTDASAQEVVQETWLAVVTGLAGFEGRSSLRTWVFRILVNRAKTRGVQDRRTITFSALAEDREPTVDPGRFRGPEDQYPGGWRSFPAAWRSAEDQALDSEVRRHLRSAFAELPDRQRIVLTLRDVMGCTAPEVCDLLDVSPANQRVLLHRGRAAVRATLAAYLGGEPSEEDG